MIAIPKDFIGYFGTVHGPGHFLEIFNDGGMKLTALEHQDLAGDFDSDYWLRVLPFDSFKIIHYNGCTIVGIARSVDDARPGCRSLMILGGERDKDYIREVLTKNEWLRNKFSELANKFCND